MHSAEDPRKRLIVIDLQEGLALATWQGDEVGVAVEGRIVLARSSDLVCEVADSGGSRPPIPG
jgi:hypothetical protein